MGGTLLLADDSITIQKVVELTFAESEHKVVAVGSGRDLFARLAEIKPDVVLCDVVMPDINGYEVCQTLKSDPNTLHLPVVLLTGTFEPFDRDRALAAGCDAIVTKPFEARELINVVEDLLRRAQSVAAIPMSGESGLGDQGIPDGVPSLDFSTTGFDELAAKIPPPPPMPEEGIELTSSSLGDSRPSKQVPAPPELAEPEVPTAVSALTQSFAFGGDEAEAPPPVPMAEALAPPAPAPEAPSFAAGPPSFAPEAPAFVSEPPRPGAVTPVAPEPFAVGEKGSESAHELFATEPAEPEPVRQPPLAPPPLPPRVPVGEGVPAQHLPTRPTLVSQPANEPPPPDRIPAEAALGAAVPLAVGALSAEVVEQVMRHVKELIPPPAPADLFSDEHVERIARRAAELVPQPPAPPTAAELLTDEHVERIARRAAELAPQPPAPPTAAELLTDEHVERVAKRAAELVPQPPAPLTAAELLTDEHVERVAKRAAELVPPPPPLAADLSDEQIEKIAKRVIELATPVIERIAWEVVPDMAEMMVRKRILELESAAEEDS